MQQPSPHKLLYGKGDEGCVFIKIKMTSQQFIAQIEPRWRMQGLGEQNHHLREEVMRLQHENMDLSTQVSYVSYHVPVHIHTHASTSTHAITSTPKHICICTKSDKYIHAHTHPHTPPPTTLPPPCPLYPLNVYGGAGGGGVPARPPRPGPH